MILPRSPTRTGHELAMRLRGAYSFFRRRGNVTLAPLGMSSDQFVLLTLLAQDGPATQQELVWRCYSDTTTLGAMLALLEARGLVRREANAQDGRSWIVSLTTAGEALQRELWRRSQGVRAELEVLFSAEEKTALMALLDRVIEAMKPERRARKKPARPHAGRFTKRIPKASRRKRMINRNRQHR